MWDKKADEQFFVERFLAAAKLDLSIEPGEVPDFRLGSGAEWVGLEVTRLFHPTQTGAKPRQEIESLRKRVIREAQSAYEGAGGALVHVSVFFSSWKHFGKSDVGLANSLCHVVLRNCPEPESRIDESYNWLNREWFPEEFNHITVRRTSSLVRSHWSAPDSEYVPMCSPDLIQQTIAKKGCRFVAYTKVLPECWLLIVADDFSLSGNFDLPADALAYEYISPFSRTYLLRAFKGQVHRLKASVVPPTV